MCVGLRRLHVFARSAEQRVRNNVCGPQVVFCAEFGSNVKHGFSTPNSHKHYWKQARAVDPTRILWAPLLLLHSRCLRFPFGGEPRRPTSCTTIVLSTTEVTACIRTAWSWFSFRLFVFVDRQDHRFDYHRRISRSIVSVNVFAVVCHPLICSPYYSSTTHQKDARQILDESMLDEVVPAGGSAEQGEEVAGEELKDSRVSARGDKRAGDRMVTRPVFLNFAEKNGSILSIYQVRNIAARESIDCPCAHSFQGKKADRIACGLSSRGDA